MKLDTGIGGYLAGDDELTGGDEAFACHLGFRVTLEIGVEDSVGDLIGHFVGMAFGDGFTGEWITYVAHGRNVLGLLLCVGSALAEAGDDVVAFAARLCLVTGSEVHAYTLGGAIGFVDGAVEPPGAVVVPEGVVGAVGLLTA